MLYIKLFIGLLLCAGFYTGVANASINQNLRPFTISHPLSRGIQTLTGINFISRKVAEHAIAKALAPTFKHKPNVHLKLYSATDLAAGKLKSIEISGKHLTLGMPFTQLCIKSESPIWLQLNGKTRLKIPVKARFSGMLSENDLNNNLNLKPTALKLKLPGLGEQTLVALQPHIAFLPDAIQLKTTLNIPGAPAENALPLVLDGQLTPNAERNRLVWRNLSVSSLAFQSPAQVSRFVEDQFGKVLSFGGQKISGHPISVIIENSRIETKQWTMDATITVLPPKP